MSWFMLTLARQAEHKYCQSQLISDSSVFMVLASGASSQSQQPEPLVSLARASQPWRWRPVAFMGAGMGCPFSSRVQIALFNWQSKVFRPCRGPFIGRDPFLLISVSVQAFIYFLPMTLKTAPVRRSRQYIIASKAGSHFSCPKRWCQLE